MFIVGKNGNKDPPPPKKEEEAYKVIFTAHN